jgi:hypothetical protein
MEHLATATLILLICAVSYIFIKEFRVLRSTAFGDFKRRTLINEDDKQQVLDLNNIVTEVFGPAASLQRSVSFGMILEGTNSVHGSRISRVAADFIVVDATFNVLCVIEHKGLNKHRLIQMDRATAKYYERLSRAACATAGISIVEIPENYSVEVLRERLLALRPAT